MRLFFFLKSRLTVILIPVLTFIIYLPSVFRNELVTCVLPPDGSIIYQKRDNVEFLETLFYSVRPFNFYFLTKKH